MFHFYESQEPLYSSSLPLAGPVLPTHRLVRLISLSRFSKSERVRSSRSSSYLSPTADSATDAINTDVNTSQLLYISLVSSKSILIETRSKASSPFSLSQSFGLSLAVNAWVFFRISGKYQPIYFSLHELTFDLFPRTGGLFVSF